MIGAASPTRRRQPPVKNRPPLNDSQSLAPNREARNFTVHQDLSNSLIGSRKTCPARRMVEQAKTCEIRDTGVGHGLFRSRSPGFPGPARGLASCIHAGHSPNLAAEADGNRTRRGTFVPAPILKYDPEPVDRCDGCRWFRLPGRFGPDPRPDLTMLAMVVEGSVSKPLATASRVGD